MRTTMIVVGTVAITAALTAKASNYMTLRVIISGGSIKGTLRSMAAGRTLQDDIESLSERIAA